MCGTVENMISSNRTHITERCLIAADIDKTILAQTLSERSEFLKHVAPNLIKAAELGVKLAFVTGNSMPELTTRFLQWLLSQLCHTDSLNLLGQFHFFCNSGGVYTYFPLDDPEISALLFSQPSQQRKIYRKIIETLTFTDSNGERLVKPRFVDSDYIKRTQISNTDIEKISVILTKRNKKYLRKFKMNLPKFKKQYDLEQVSSDGKLIVPNIDCRAVSFGTEAFPSEATVQLTLKPILSFRHGKTDKLKISLFENDLRTELVREIQEDLEREGLGYYVPRAGGRSSIDVTLEKLDKAYGLEFLIDHLNLQGHKRLGRKFGSNTIYFGDEVIVGGGNDYSVTRIPGLLIFAVNADRHLVPFLSHVFVPSSIMEGPEATSDVLTEFNTIARDLIKEHEDQDITENSTTQYISALDVLKVNVFSERIRKRVELLKSRGDASPEDWQTLHAFVTLMSRKDPAARQWLAILVSELDAIMTQISEHPQPTQLGIGASHPDC